MTCMGFGVPGSGLGLVTLLLRGLEAQRQLQGWPPVCDFPASLGFPSLPASGRGLLRPWRFLALAVGKQASASPTAHLRDSPGPPAEAHLWVELEELRMGIDVLPGAAR